MIRLALTAVAAIALCLAFGETKEAEAQYTQPGWSSGNGQLMISGLNNGKRRRRRRGGSQPIIISGGLNSGNGSNGCEASTQPVDRSFTGGDKFSEYLRFVIYHQMIHDRQDEMSSMEQTRQIEELIRQRVSDAAKQHLIERLMAKAQQEEAADTSLQEQLMQQLQQARSDANAKAVLQAIIASKRAAAPSTQPAAPQVMLLPAEPQQAQITYRAKYLRVQPRKLIPLRRVR